MSSFKRDPGYDPHTYRFACGEDPQSAERKAPHAHAIYLNLGDFARVGVER